MSTSRADGSGRSGVEVAIERGVDNFHNGILKAVKAFGACMLGLVVISIVLSIATAPTKEELHKKYSDSRNCFFDVDNTPYPNGFERKIAEQLRDPDSLKMGGTTITGSTKGGGTTFDTEIRAKNGFGGYTVEVVHGVMYPQCVSMVLGMDQA